MEAGQHGKAAYGFPLFAMKPTYLNVMDHGVIVSRTEVPTNTCHSHSSKHEDTFTHASQYREDLLAVIRFGHLEPLLSLQCCRFEVS